MSCTEPPGPMLMARTFDRQAAESQARIAILDRHTALGAPAAQPIG